MQKEFADIVIPVAVSGSYTYGIPQELRGALRRGSIVTVPFGQSSNATGLVISIHSTPPSGFTPKEITALLPEEASVNERLVDFILWISEYYMAYPGEVMKAAIPSADDLPGVRVARRKRSDKTAAGGEVIMPASLNDVQTGAYNTIRELFSDHETVLLHGVTSSGKTEI